jgi:hypothetical protein
MNGILKKDLNTERYMVVRNVRPSWPDSFLIIDVPEDIPPSVVELLAVKTIFACNQTDNDAPPIFNFADLGHGTWAYALKGEIREVSNDSPRP